MSSTRERLFEAFDVEEEEEALERPVIGRGGCCKPPTKQGGGDCWKPLARKRLLVFLTRRKWLLEAVSQTEEWVVGNLGWTKRRRKLLVETFGQEEETEVVGKLLVERGASWKPSTGAGGGS